MDFTEKGSFNMNRVSCQVTSCQHNDANMCSLNKIKVDGPGANVSSGTCCASFTERKAAPSNQAGCCHASPETTIDCKAENCCYNEKKKCSAGSVNVGCCCSDPKTMSETECCTFQCR